MDDNATCHRTLAVQDCLDSEGIQRLVWPARSPDLNNIGNVWDALGRQVAGRKYPPTNKNTLIRALREEWDKLPQQLLDNVVQMGDRLTNTFTKDFCVRITNTFKKDFLCLDNEHIFGGDQGYTPEIMDEILTTARDLESEVNEDDIEELIMGHED
ncbi:uncharacterized protein TNCV_4527191 [Trichonephila clavipes]|nr:uncharacterized protein TNCV_4527191 [Trichonephila clavipes]